MLGENIKKYREERNISQRELGRLIGKTGQFISLIEKNKSNPSIEVLIKIGETLNVPINKLFDLSLEDVLSTVADEDRDVITALFNKGLFNDEDKIEITENHENNDWTSEELEEIEQFKEFVKSKRSKSKYNTQKLDHKISLPFTDAKSAMDYLRKIPAMAAYGGYDIKTMTDEEIIEFANEILHQFEMVSHKYKK